MVTINTDELIGYILRKTGDDYHLDYEEVQAVLDSELEFLKSKGLTEEREDTGIYLNEGWLSGEIKELEVVGVGSFHNENGQNIKLNDRELVCNSRLMRQNHSSSAIVSLRNKLTHEFKLTYSDHSLIRGTLTFSSVGSDGFVMQIITKHYRMIPKP